MGLFSKKEKTDDMQVPPAPPVNSPAVFAGNTSVPEIQKPTEDTQKLSAPPIPGGSLEDIKNQVAAKPILSENNISNPEAQSVVEIPQTENNAQELEISQDDSDGDSLFDFSELEETPIQSNSNSYNNEEIEEAKPAKRNSIKEEISYEPIQSKNLAKDDDVDLSFIKQKNIKVEQETYFVTTKQFKSLVEIIELVKSKTKNASEIHLKLMDIKSEEDIEFENLRKDFQVIEDKLYEVDSIIFEK